MQIYTVDPQTKKMEFWILSLYDLLLQTNSWIFSELIIQSLPVQSERFRLYLLVNNLVFYIFFLNQ